MTHTPDITRPPKELIDALKEIGAATVAGTLGHMGFRNPHMVGPVPQNRGKSIVGPALTLQFMPQRPDLFTEGEYADPETQLHRHVLYHAQEGDVVVVDARGDMSSGVFGDMMSTYFKGRGGAGIVIDGCMRDRPNVEKLDLPYGYVAGLPTTMCRPASIRMRSTFRLPAAVSRSSLATSSSPTMTGWWCFQSQWPRR